MWILSFIINLLVYLYDIKMIILSLKDENIHQTKEFEILIFDVKC